MKLGIIGTGRIAKRFVPECLLVPDTSITGVYNPHKESAENFIDNGWNSQTWDRPFAISDISDLWDKADVIYIASPHETHYNYIMTSLEHGKHVLCEKPMALSKSQTEEAFDCADKQGLILMEGLKTAYCPGYQKLLTIIRDGTIGRIRYIDATFTKLENPQNRELNDRLYGGSFTELGSYVMLPVIDLLGSDYRDVSFESITNEKGIDIFTKADIRYRDAMATLICGLGVKAEGRLLISGEKGYIKVDAPWWKTRHTEVHFEDESKTVSYDEPFEGDGLRYEIQNFLDRIHSDKSTISEAMIDTMHRSITMSEIMDKFLSQRAA